MRLGSKRWLSAVVLIACGAACESEGEKPPAYTVRDAGDDTDGIVGGGAGSAAKPEGCPVQAPTQCPEPEVRYGDVAPIIEKRCLGCHDGMHGQWALTDYQHVADWFGEVRAAMIACTMPPPDSGLTMPTSERLQILTWIRCGYKK